MMKRILFSLLIIIQLVCFCACGHKTLETTSPTYRGMTVFTDESVTLPYNYQKIFVNENNIEDAQHAGNAFGVSDRNGKILVPPEYYDAKPAGADAFIVRDLENDRACSSMIDDDGNILISRFEGDIQPIYEETIKESKLVLVDPVKGERYVADMHGTTVIRGEDYDFLTLTPFGTLEAAANGVLYQFDAQGQVVRTIDSLPQPVKENEKAALVKIERFIDGHIKYGVWDENETVLVPCEYDDIDLLDTRYVIARKGELDCRESTDRSALYDAKGRTLCPEGKYQAIDYDVEIEVGIGVVIAEDGSSVSYLIDCYGNTLSAGYDEMAIDGRGIISARMGKSVITLNSDGSVSK